MTGEVLGADGGAGLQGKRVAVDRNRFKQTLSKVASSGLQMAGMMAGALTGRGAVVVNGAGYRLLNPVTDEAGQLHKWREWETDVRQSGSWSACICDGR